MRQVQMEVAVEAMHTVSKPGRSSAAGSLMVTSCLALSAGATVTTAGRKCPAEDSAYCHTTPGLNHAAVWMAGGTACLLCAGFHNTCNRRTVPSGQCS
jgi:hypothetical protein